jgi:uncharacterized protein (DUF924 family)
MAERRAQDVLDYWFGPDLADPGLLSARMRVWFAADDPPEIRLLRDEAIEARFGDLTASAARGELDAWAHSPNRLLALILLLDQFPRNIHRGTSAAFAQDERALELCLAGVADGADAALAPVHRIFFYMPLQHAESRDVQDESLRVYRRLAREAPGPLRPLFDSCLQFAQLHERIIARFGRFPHRNAVLGRASTPAEVQFLEEEGLRFGQ